jgi:hypothetical protein
MAAVTPSDFPSCVTKGENSANDSVAVTEEVSDHCSLDVNPPARTPFSNLFSCCMPKEGLEVEEEETTELVTEQEEVVVSKNRSLEVLEVPTEPSNNNEDAVKIDTGLMFQVAVLGAILLNEVIQAV